MTKGRDLTRVLLALYLVGLGFAVLAVVADSPVLLLVAVLSIVVSRAGAFALSVKAAQRDGYVLPYIASGVAAVGTAAIGVVAIIFGERGDSPGSILLGIALIVGAIGGAFAFRR